MATAKKAAAKKAPAKKTTAKKTTAPKADPRALYVAHDTVLGIDLTVPSPKAHAQFIADNHPHPTEVREA